MPAAVKLREKVYVSYRDGEGHFDALWQGIRELSSLTPEDHKGGLKGDARARRDAVVAQIDEGKIPVEFGWVDDAGNFNAGDHIDQRIRKSTYL